MGEISLLKRQKTTARVVALGEVRALFLDKQKFFEVLDENPDVSEYLDGLTSDRLKRGSEPPPLEMGRAPTDGPLA